MSRKRNLGNETAPTAARGARLRNLALLALLLGADLGSKALAEAYLKGKGVVKLLGELLVLVYSENHGAFLSLGAGFGDLAWTLLFLVLPAVVVLLVMVELARKPALDLKGIAFLLVVAGGLGNLADRAFRAGYVRDFINAGIGSLRTGILNVADLYITGGVILLAILSFRGEASASKS